MTGRGLDALAELQFSDALCRGIKGTLSPPRGMKVVAEGKKTQAYTSGLNPILGTEVPVAGKRCVIALHGQKLGHREKQNSRCGFRPQQE